MIIALLALALAMILGGLVSAFLGWDIILVERGWTMVIAGSISAASGALLLGITAAISKLSSIQAELVRLQDSFSHMGSGAYLEPDDASLSDVSGGLLTDEVPEVDDAQDRDEDVEPSSVYAGHTARDATEPARDRRGDETEALAEEAKPAAPVLPFRARSSFEETTPVEDEHQAKVPDFLLANRDRDEGRGGEDQIVNRYREPTVENRDSASRVSDPNDSLYVAEPAVEEQMPRADGTPDGIAEPAPDEEAAQPEPVAPPAIVGTYNSGDNKYVMYSDGSIEAQTPNGIYRFKSLDELKEFIAAGGEGGSSTAT